MRVDIYAVAAIAVMAGVTLLLRVLPFLIFGEKKVPEYVEYLGKYLPYAMIGMLVIYCLKDIAFTQAPFGLPELASMLLAAVLHVWKRNTLISIVGGTLCYMCILQFL